MGVWLKAKHKDVRLRDGTSAEDLAYDLTPSGPAIFFTKRTREMHLGDKDTEVINKKPPTDSEVAKQQASAEALRDARKAKREERKMHRIEIAREANEKAAADAPEPDDADKS